MDVATSNMLNIFRTFVLIALSSLLFYYYGNGEGLVRRAPTNFISQCSTLVPNMVALTIMNIGPHLNDWIAALAIQNVKVTFMLDREALKNTGLVNTIFNAGHNIGIDAFPESLSTENIVSTLRDVGELIGPVILKTPRFYTLGLTNAEELASAALPSALYAVKINTEFLKSGNIIAQVTNKRLVGNQTIIGMTDSAASQIDTEQFSSFLYALKSMNNLVSLADCTQKTSAYDLWFPNSNKKSASPGSTDSGNVKQTSSGGAIKWFLF